MGLRALLAKAAEAVERIKIVICREDLPRNPRWAAQGYPDEHCWDIDELFEEAVRAGPQSRLYREARRIWWEAYWRLLGRYRRGRRFFDVYIIAGGVARPARETEIRRQVLYDIIVAGHAHGIVPAEARETAHRLYTRLFGPLAR